MVGESLAMLVTPPRSVGEVLARFLGPYHQKRTAALKVAERILRLNPEDRRLGT